MEPERSECFHVESSALLLDWRLHTADIIDQIYNYSEETENRNKENYQSKINMSFFKCALPIVTPRGLLDARQQG